MSQPSWAPDWWHPPQRTRLPESLQFDERGCFETLNFYCSEECSEQDLNDTSPFLILKGVVLGIINVDGPPTSLGGFPLVHVPPICAGCGHKVLTHPDKLDFMVPQVYMSLFSDAVNRHMNRDCPYFPFHERGSHKPSSSCKPFLAKPQTSKSRFSGGFSFLVTGFARLDNVEEDKCPAQVLASSVETGDFLVLLEDGGLPFLLRPLKNLQDRLTKVHELSSFAHPDHPLPDDAGMFVLVGEASICWDKLWPHQWDTYC